MNRRSIAWQYLIVSLTVLGFGFVRGFEDRPTRGTLMVFLIIVPIFFSAFGNFALSTCRRMGPVNGILNTIGVMCFEIAVSLGVFLLMRGSTFIVLLMGFDLAAVVLCSISFIITILDRRREATTWFRLPFYVWSLFATAVLLIPCSLLFEFCVVLTLSGFSPPLTSVSTNAAGELWGGSRIAWHFIWFLGHPEVVVIGLLFLGGMAEGIRLILFGRR